MTIFKKLQRITGTARIYTAFVTLCFIICLTYSLSVTLYHPLLLPTKFDSRKLVLYNDKLCADREEVTVMYIYSRINRYSNRDAIRRTYGNATIFGKFNLKIFFVLGREYGCQHGDSILPEYAQYKDILMGDFIDTYRNLSLKGIIALDFISKYCKNARFVIKADDDVLVNTPAILSHMYLTHGTAKQTIWGMILSGANAFYCIRNYNKWCILSRDFNRTTYPPYMNGIGFVYTSDLVQPLLEAADGIHPFPIDDVYITGLLLERVKQKTMVDWTPYITVQAEESIQRIQVSREALFFAHSLQAKQILDMWPSLENKKTLLVNQTKQRGHGVGS